MEFFEASPPFDAALDPFKPPADPIYRIHVLEGSSRRALLQTGVDYHPPSVLQTPG